MLFNAYMQRPLITCLELIVIKYRQISRDFTLITTKRYKSIFVTISKLPILTKSGRLRNQRM